MKEIIDTQREMLGEFIIGENKIPCFIAEHLLEDTLSYNPIYFWGPTASGKTMLLKTLAEKMRMLYPEKTIIYYNSDAYVNEFTYALRKNDYHASLYLWKQKNAKADVLFFDDFDFLTTGKRASLQAFFQMFNDLHLQQKQIIIASNQKPKDIKLEEKYKSRLLMGIACEMYCPDAKTREQILKRKCEKHKIVLNPEILKYIACTIENAGTLTGVFNRMSTLEEGERQALTLNKTESILSDFIRRDALVTIEDVLNEVADYYNVTLEELIGKRRSRNIVLARQVAMYVVRNVVKDMTNLEIARAFNRNHTSVFYATNKIEAELKSGGNTYIVEAVCFITDKIKNK